MSDIVVQSGDMWLNDEVYDDGSAAATLTIGGVLCEIRPYIDDEGRASLRYAVWDGSGAEMRQPVSIRPTD